MTEREMARKKAAARKARARKARARRVAMTVALMLVVCVASVGGTIAWLQDKTENVTNTFSPSNIEIDLNESGTEDQVGDKSQDFQLVPGKNLEKDPNVYANSDVDYYVFVKVTEKNWPHNLKESDGVTEKLSYQIADGWTWLSTTDDSVSGTVEYVYYKTVKANTSVGSKDATTGAITGASILKNDQVYVSEELTKTDMQTIADAGQPQLTFKAYAIQQLQNNEDLFTPEEAWAQVNS